MNTPADAEGRIDIRLDWQTPVMNPAAQATVRLRSSRPVLACRLFEQRRVEQTLSLVPMLFSVCGRAQSVAAVRAMESALTTPASTAVETHRDALVMLESIREHLWRLLMDWPSLMGAAARTDLLAPLNQALNAMMTQLAPGHALSNSPGLQQTPADSAPIQSQWRSLRAEIERSVFAGDSAGWLDSDGDGSLIPPLAGEPDSSSLLWNWLAERGWLALGDVGLRPLPPLADGALARRFAADDCDQWVAQPDWQGQLYESGALASHADHPRIVACQRQWGYALATRLLARLVALAELLGSVDHALDGSVARRPLSGHRGLAQLETSRGRLVHHVEITAGVVTRYRILAPTEWNFHPRGIAARILASLSGDQPAAIIDQQARWLLQLIDPCVGIELSINRASADSDRPRLEAGAAHA